MYILLKTVYSARQFLCGKIVNEDKKYYKYENFYTINVTLKIRYIQFYYLPYRNE